MERTMEGLPGSMSRPSLSGAQLRPPPGRSTSGIAAVDPRPSLSAEGELHEAEHDEEIAGVVARFVERAATPDLYPDEFPNKDCQSRCPAFVQRSLGSLSGSPSTTRIPGWMPGLR